MRLPRNLSGQELAKALRAYGYVISRQTGSHMRLTTELHGEHHLTIPAMRELRLGTLAGIVAEVARHFEATTDEIIARLFGTGH